MDDVDYKNYDNKYYEKEKYLKEKKKDLQFYNNFRIKSNNLKPIILEINTKLFNCKFNAFENKSGITKFIEEDGILFLLLVLEYYYQVIFRITKEQLGKAKNNIDEKNNEKSYIHERIINDNKMSNLNEEKNKENYDIYSFNFLSKEQNKILECISNDIEDILQFFLKKIIKLNFFVKYYKIGLFFSQINLVLKQYLLIKDLDSKIYDLLLNYFEIYYKFINNNFKLNKFPDENIIRIRNFFFDFLLNPELYRRRNENILNKLNNFFDLLNGIINDNHYNEELFNKKIFKKIIGLMLIFYAKNNEFYKNIAKNYISFLSNYINKFYFNSKEGKSIINILYEMIEDYKSKTEYNFISLCLSFALFKSDITFYSDENTIEKIKSYLSKNNLEINNISFIIILCGYYLYDSKNIINFKHMLINLNFSNEKIILMYLLNIFKIVVKDDIEIKDIFYDSIKDQNIQIGLNLENLSKFQEKYFENLLELISLFIIDEKDIQDNNRNILIYNTIKNILLEISKVKHIKLFKIIFSGENFICTKLFSKYLTEYENVTIIGKDVIKFTEELITFHNNPFIFELIKKINKENEEEEEKQNDQSNKEIKKIRINIVIKILDTIYISLKKFNFPVKNRKQNKYFLRGIINLLITINNICEMKEKLYIENDAFLHIFRGLIKLAEKLDLIYLNYCIKINDQNGKLIIELIFDSFIYIINSKNNKNNPKIKKLFHKVFVRSNKKQNAYCTLFYLMDLIKIFNLDLKKQNFLLQFNIDLSKIKEINELLKTKKSYKIQKFFERSILPNYKCIFPIENVNISIYFCSKIYLFLRDRINEHEFKKYLIDIFLTLLNSNILALKTKWIKYYDETKNEDINRDIELYNLVKEFYDNNSLSNHDDSQALQNFLFKELSFKLMSRNDIKVYTISAFIWKISDENIELEKDNNIYKDDSLDKNNLMNSFHLDNNRSVNSISNKAFEENNSEEKKYLVNDKLISKAGFIKINSNINGNKRELERIKDSLKNVKYYSKNFGFFDDINKRCFIYNPKHFFIKRVFSHIFYRLIFYDKTFMYIKYKYLRKFPTANVITKQLNFPSKIKNFSNIYEPKLFLRKDFNFYESNLFLKTDKNSEYRAYFQITHDFLIKDKATDKKSSEKKEKETKNLIDSKISLVNFYEHYFNINDIIGGEENYFDCELVTQQYVYFGYIIFDKNYFYFGTKNENPVNYREYKNEKINIDLFLKFCFSVRNCDNKTEKKKRLIIFYQDIKLVIKRRILLMYQAMEIFCDNGKSYFFNLYQKRICERIFKLFNKINFYLDNRDKFKILNENDINVEVKNLQQKINKNFIDNYLLLSKINFYSSRAFNDLSQYPIFPWIILDFDKLNILLNNISNIEKRDFLIYQKNNNDSKKENETLKVLITNNQQLFEICGLRVFNYPISVQTEEKRIKSIERFRDDIEESEGEFVYHHGTHYSMPSNIYYFLMRNNPFTKCMIKLQNYNKINPNKAFVSYKEIIYLFKTQRENRELIPDFFCHFDYYINLNCNYNGNKSNGLLVDDFYCYNRENGKSENLNSIYLKFVFLFRKLLNSNLISRYLPQWIDNIFGKNQLPDNPKDLESSCNIFRKSTYEQKMKLDKIIEKYYKLYTIKALNAKDFVKKVLLKIDKINNLGITPHKVLDDIINLKTRTEQFKTEYRYFKINKGIYFINSNDEILILFKNEKDNIKKIASWNYKTIYKGYKLEELDKKKIYPCGYIKRLNKYLNNKYKIPIFKPCYTMSNIYISNKLFILTCRYLGNIFKVMNSDSYIDVLCEDFVTCIICNKIIDSNKDDDKIYTGLKNGKLIEWIIKPSKDEKKILIREKKNAIAIEGK